MKYLKLFWSVVSDYIFVIMTIAAIAFALTGISKISFQAKELVFNFYIFTALLLAGTVAIRVADRISARIEYRILFFSITGLNMFIAKLYMANPSETIALMLVTHMPLGATFILAYIITKRPKTIKS